MNEHDALVRHHLQEIYNEPEAWAKMLEVLYQRAIQKQLRETRLLNGWTVADVAGRMGAQPEFLEMLETEVFPNYKLSTLQIWARALGLKIRIDLQPLHIFEEPGAPDAT